MVDIFYPFIIVLVKISISAVRPKFFSQLNFNYGSQEVKSYKVNFYDDMSFRVDFPEKIVFLLDNFFTISISIRSDRSKSVFLVLVVGDIVHLGKYLHFCRGQ